MDQRAPSEADLHKIRQFADKPTRDAIGRQIADELARKLPFPPTSLSPEDKQIVETIRRKGWSVAPPLFSADDIIEIERYIAARPLTFVHVQPGRRTEALLTDRPVDARSGRWDQQAVSLCPEFCAAAHDPRLIELVQEYLGAPPTILHLQLAGIFPSNGDPVPTQKFHHDIEDFSALKIFVYLTDVTEDDGPHEYVEESHSLESLERFAVQRNFGPAERDRLKALVEARPKSESEIDAVFGPPRSVTGPKGTTFIVDPGGFHRGRPPISGGRLMFEIDYCLRPRPSKDHVAVARPDYVFLDPRIEWATRIFYT